MEKNIEFEEMKQQLHLLQQRLDKQVEINERQTRRAIEDGMSHLGRKDKRMLLVCTFIAFIIPFSCLGQGLPTYFAAGTFIFLLANVAWQYFLCFDDRELAAINLVEAARRLTKYKKNCNLGILIGIPIALCWVFWYAMESGKLNPFNEDPAMLLTSIAIGLCIGFAIGIKFIYLPKMRTINRLLRQIDDLQNEN